MHNTLHTYKNVSVWVCIDDSKDAKPGVEGYKAALETQNVKLVMGDKVNADGGVDVCSCRRREGERKALMHRWWSGCA